MDASRALISSGSFVPSLSRRASAPHLSIISFVSSKKFPSLGRVTLPLVFAIFFLLSDNLPPCHLAGNGRM